MKSYVLGFLFSEDKEKVWLIRKNRPDWQSGKLNGIGGKLERDEKPIDAMKREFKEEAGLEINDWKLFCKLTDEKEFEVYCYYSFSNETPKTMTDEEIVIDIPYDLSSKCLPNLYWLIPMALSFTEGERCKRFVVTEIHSNIKENKEGLT